jgi:MerR family transcriptional regulator/heat shock protein HspR
MFGGMSNGADEDMPVFVISVAAQLSGLHAQTLRSYDRLGLVSPGRTSGGGRRYSMRDIALLREVQRLSQSDGVNLAGIKRIIELENQVDALQARLAELTEELAGAYAAAQQAAAAVHASYRKDLVPIRHQTALVVWKPDRR